MGSHNVDPRYLILSDPVNKRPEVPILYWKPILPGGNYGKSDLTLPWSPAVAWQPSQNETEALLLLQVR